MKTICLLLAAILVMPPNNYAAVEGALDAAILDQFRLSCAMNSSDRAIYNALTNNDINELALNRDLVNDHNTLFSHKVKAKGITNQKSSGRCWLFAGLNIMRPTMIEKYKLGEFEFSEIYLTFYDKLEKANTFLENIIATRDRDYLDRELVFIVEHPFDDGGYWDYVVDLIEKYGVVPKEVMPETHNSNNTGMVNQLIIRKLRQDATVLRDMSQKGADEKALRAKKMEMLGETYKMMVLNLGEPPKSFTWRYEDRDTVLSKPKVYTPQEFYRIAVGVDLKDYVSIVDHPARERMKYYRMNWTRNIHDTEDISFINLPIDRLKEFALKSVLDDQPVWFANDVGKQNDREHGILADGVLDYSSIYGTDFKLTKADRLLLRDSAPNHAMVLIGVNLIDGKPEKWLVENSWGSEKGDGGKWTMYDSWFDEYVYEVIINRKYIPKDILQLMETKPVELPPWDPMWELLRID
ncbi:MAG: aminopeptidase [candidate division Zixibacteria bacterium CG_4_9_14_3_um_filter_46_8]|nr:MAG: aminopeptidase [candidate division Zixibacteria bacterium CG_4_9_14_3_um_filter_46_8]